MDSNSLDDKIKLSESEMNGSLDDEDAINLDDPAGIMDLDDDDSKSPDFEKLETIEDLEDEDVEEEIREAESIGDPIEDDENGDDLDKLILDETDRLSTSSHGYQKLNSDESCDKFLSSDDKNRLDENSCSVRGGSDSQENSREATSLQSNGMDKTRQLEQDDDDKPVSIPSDTNSEDEPDEEEHDGDMGTANKTNGTCDSPEVHEILSDKEDCVVIEDSLSPAKAYDSQQRRQRKSTIRAREYPSYDDDIEEIIEDPIAINSTTTIQPVMKKAKLTLPPSTQLSLRDANGNRSSNIGSDLSITPSGGKGSSGKEPTLVLIDTKSILNNRNNSNARNSPATSLANLSKNIGFSISPVAAGGGGTSMASSNLPGMYPQPNIRATITPINNSSNNNKSTTATIANNNSSTKSSSSSSTPSQQQQQQLMNSVPHTQLPALIPTHSNGGNILLPALTDDMFVLEAPSFIVPYIYEKPPPENLKEVVGQIGTILAQQRKKTGGQQPDEKREDGVGVKKAEDGVQQGQQEAGKKNRRKGKNPDDSWDESDTSTDEEASDSETRTKVLIKEANQDIETIILPTDTSKPEPSVENKPVNSDNYFESPLGQFFMAIGVNLVQEHVQTDLMRIQKKKAIREGAKPSAQVQTAINALMKNLEVSKKSNKPFKFENKRCEFCNFKSESALVMTNHYEKPHLRGNAYRCNFCEFETRPAHDMLFHMEAVHNVKSKLDKPLSYHQCPNCPFEDNGKSKLARHSLACTKKFMPETNLTPPPDWDPPAKIPRVKPRHGLVGTATAYQAMAAQQQRINAAGILNRMNMGANVNNINNTNTIGLMNNSNITNLTNNAGANRNRGRPQVGGHNLSKGMGAGQGARGQGSIRSQLGCDMMMPNNFNQLAAKHLNNNQLLQMAANQAMMPNTHSSLTIQVRKGNKVSEYRILIIFYFSVIKSGIQVVEEHAAAKHFNNAVATTGNVRLHSRLTSSSGSCFKIRDAQFETWPASVWWQIDICYL